MRTKQFTYPLYNGEDVKVPAGLPVAPASLDKETRDYMKRRGNGGPHYRLKSATPEMLAYGQFREAFERDGILLDGFQVEAGLPNTPLVGWIISMGPVIAGVSLWHLVGVEGWKDAAAIGMLVMLTWLVLEGIKPITRTKLP